MPQGWYPATDAAALGIGLAAWSSYRDILAARADRMAVIRRIVASLDDEEMRRPCRRAPAPGYPEEERTAVRDLAVLETG